MNKQYKRYAIDALGKFLDGFAEVDYYLEVKAMLFMILENNEDEDEDEEHDKPLQLMVMASSAKAIGLAWTRNAQLQGTFFSCLHCILFTDLRHAMNQIFTMSL